MKKLIALLMAAVMMTGILAGCGGGGDDAGYTEDGIKETLIIGSDADIKTLDLQKQQDQVNNIILKNTHQNLVFFTNEQTFEPGLASSWEYDDTNTVLTMYLRKDVKFSNGEPMTSADVVFTLEMAMDESTGSIVKSVLAGMVGVTAIDEYTIQITLEEINNEFIASLASLPLAIQCKKAYDDGVEEPYLIGTGPYKYVEWVEKQYLKLEKVEGYWGENPTEDLPEYYEPGVSPYIEFRPYTDQTARVLALENGEIDVCINPPMNELANLEAMDGVTVYEKAGTRLFYFGFNTQDETLSNLTLRQAIACAIDREAVLEAAVEGKGELQTTILNRGLWSFYDEMEGFDYDVERAKQLLAEAGYADGLELTLLHANTGSYKTVAEVIQANLREIGITVTLEQAEEATLKEACGKGEQQLFLWRWNEDSKVDFVYRDLYYTGSKSNFHQYSNPKADELTDTVLHEPNEDARYAASVELQELLVEECPQVPLYIANLVIAYNENLQGEYLFGGGNHVWAHAYVQKAE